MAVYFEPARRSWLDYVAPVVGQLLGGAIQQGFDKNKEIRTAKQAQETADAEQARKWADQDRTSEFMRVLGLDSSDPSNYQRDLFTMAMRDPSVAQYIQGIAEQGDPRKTPFALNAGDRTIYGGFNSRTGGVDSQQEAMHGVNPTDALVSNNALAGTKYAADSNVKAEGMRQRGQNYRTGAAANQPKAAQMFQDANGDVHWVDPYNRTTTPMGIQGPQPKQSQGPSLKDLGSVLGTFLDPYTGQPLPGYEGVVGEFRDQIVKSMGGVGAPPAVAQGNQLPQQPTEAPMDSGVEAQIGSMMQLTGKSREEVVAYLRAKGLL